MTSETDVLTPGKTERKEPMKRATVGIDVAKAHLDVAVVWSEGKATYQRFSNRASGHQALKEWLHEQTPLPLPVCLEATGRYGEAIALFLHQQGYPVSVVNPAPVKVFAAALSKRHKTDKSDAQVLALYQAKMQPARWQPPQPGQTQLQELKRLADDLQDDRTRVKNRLEGSRAGSPARRYLDEQLQYIEQQLTEVEQEIGHWVENDPPLQAQCHLLESIVGIGRRSAQQLLAELPDLSRFTSADQLVAYAGLYPRQKQSGNQQPISWLSKQGSARLRKALYFPALSAKVHNPHLTLFADRLTERGKAKMAVVAAVMRKLLVLVYAILKSGRPYDPHFGFST
jgi:transposase